MFATVDDISKFLSTFSALHFEKSSNVAKKIKKAWFNLPFKFISPFSTVLLTAGRYPKPGFRIPIPPLVYADRVHVPTYLGSFRVSKGDDSVFVVVQGGLLHCNSSANRDGSM